MIISDKGGTIIRGNLADLTQEFCAIFSAIMDKSPEIVLAVQAQYADDMIDLLPKIDEIQLGFCNKVASNFIKLNKENEDD